MATFFGNYLPLPSSLTDVLFAVTTKTVKCLECFNKVSLCFTEDEKKKPEPKEAVEEKMVSFMNLVFARQHQNIFNNLKQL